MTNLVDIFTVFRSVEFLEKCESDEEKNNAINGIQAEALSFFCSRYGCIILACLLTILIKLM